MLCRISFVIALLYLQGGCSRPEPEIPDIPEDPPEPPVANEIPAPTPPAEPIPSHPPEEPDRPVGPVVGLGCEIEGTWTADVGADIEFANDGVLIGGPDAVGARWSVEGQLLEVSDGWRCVDPRPGVYALSFSNDCGELLLGRMEDPCTSRSNALSSRALTRPSP